MTDMFRCTCALIAALFAIVLLAGILAFGQHEARVAALVAAFLGVVSQFSAQGIYQGEGNPPDKNAEWLHIATSYFGFAVVLVAIVLFAIGR